MDNIKQITAGDYTSVYSCVDYPNVRICVRLDEKVDGDLLSEATQKTAERYPYFCVKLIRGEKEYYLEDNPLPVKTFNQNTSAALQTEETNYHVWAVCYYDDFIYFDVFHGLADGNHMFRMLSTLLYYYMSEKYGDAMAEDILTLEVPIADEEPTDPIDELELPETLSMPERQDPEHHPAFKCIEDGKAEAGEHVFYDIAIPEAEFVRFTSEYDSTPGNMITLLAARAFDSLFPNSDKPPVGNYFINGRPMLGAKNTQHNCFAMARMEYDRTVKAMDFREQCRFYREKTRFYASPEFVRNYMLSLAIRVNMLRQISSMDVREQMIKGVMASIKPFITYGVSYVGKWKYVSMEKHIKELWSHVVGRSEISIEMNAVSGNIFVSYQQGIKDEIYVKAFMEQLDSFNIPYKLVRKVTIDTGRGSLSQRQYLVR
ncbi:MAG: hypothetical protein IJ703_02785 [Eubacterium sp.]|nr:hypothetical protein [Eubacterium sp.]